MHIFQIALTVSLLIGIIRGQSSSTEKLTDSPSEDFIDLGQDGSYRFGYKNIDRGEHYHSSAASADNTVSGRYGYRDPAAKRIVQTTYTAGERGFRANGPNIARKMDLSQTKIPYQPPVPINSPNYRPTYDGYHDPNEDSRYDFNFKTPTYSRGESSDAKGAVSGSFSYVDDVGKRHDVSYEADSKNGFNVKTPFPDSDPFSGVFYQGPNKPGTLPRGHSAVVRSNDGSYRFTASGPDQQRTEVSDAAGRVRGSYTYIDDKGVQRTVQYVAGPNIGYKVIRKGAGPVYSSVYPYARPEFISPTLNDVGNIPNVDEISSKSSPKSSSSSSSVDLDRDIPDIRDDFNGNNNNNDFSSSNAVTNDNRQFDFPAVQQFNKPNKSPPRVGISGGGNIGGGNIGSGNIGGGNIGSAGGSGSSSSDIGGASYDTFKTSAGETNVDERNNRRGGGFLPPGAAGYLTPYTGGKSSGGSAFPEDNDPSSRRKITESPFNPDRPAAAAADYGKFHYDENALENDDFRKPFLPPPRRPSYGRPTADGYDYPKPATNKGQQFFEQDRHNSGSKGYSREAVHYPPPQQQQPPDDEDYTADVRSAATAIRAHVQSLDILPYGLKVPSPEDVMTQHENESSR